MFRLPDTSFPALRVAFLAMAATLCVPAVAQGIPRSIGECERLKNDLAYNQCLAMFGPEARMITGGDGAPGRNSAAPQASAAAMAAIPYAADAPVAADEASSAQEPHHNRYSRYSRRSGRQTASFDIGGGSSRRHWRRRH